MILLLCMLGGWVVGGAIGDWLHAITHRNDP